MERNNDERAAELAEQILGNTEIYYGTPSEDEVHIRAHNRAQELKRILPLIRRAFDADRADAKAQIARLEPSARAWDTIAGCMEALEEADHDPGKSKHEAVDGYIKGWQKQRERIRRLLEEREAIVFAAHMPADYEHGLPSWINQRLYAAYIGAYFAPEVMQQIESGALRFENGAAEKENRRLRWKIAAARKAASSQYVDSRYMAQEVRAALESEPPEGKPA